MRPRAGALWQLDLPEAPLGLVVALTVFAAAILLLALRGVVDWLFGPEPETAAYRLVDADGELVIADADQAHGRRLVGIEEAQMEDLLARAEDRNEMRLHTVLGPEGRRFDWETWRVRSDRESPAGVVLEDSKGLVEIHATGRIEATPPLDEAVRGDLLEVLERVLGVEPP